MALTENQIYHCFNQGNNREIIFKQDNDYVLFIDLIRKYVQPNCDILAWCLMPNHFHLLLHTTLQSVQPIKVGSLSSQILPNAIRILLSTYAQIFNEQYNRSGSLFRQKTKFKNVEFGDRIYDLSLIEYLHNNPVAAGLVANANDWEYSSAKDYSGERKGMLVNVKFARELLQI